MSDVDQDLKDKMNEQFQSMKDNTEFVDEKSKIRFAKLNMSAEVVDFLIEHYGFFDLVELNQITLYLFKSIALMEKDGFKIAAYRTVDGKPEAFELNIEDMIARFRMGLSQSSKKDEPYNPNIEIKEGESNEKNSV
jgi:hypothetical protein